MYHRVRRKTYYWYFTFITILILGQLSSVITKSIDIKERIFKTDHSSDDFDNNIIDFDSAYDSKINRNYEIDSWNQGDRFNKESHRYTVEKQEHGTKNKVQEDNKGDVRNKDTETYSTTESTNIPTELLSTTENVLLSLIESTAEPDLTVIPLSTTQKVAEVKITTDQITIQIIQPSTSTTSTKESETTENIETTTNISDYDTTTDNDFTTIAPTSKENSTEIRQNITNMKMHSMETTQNVTAMNIDTKEMKQNMTHMISASKKTKQNKTDTTEESTNMEQKVTYTTTDFNEMNQNITDMALDSTSSNNLNNITITELTNSTTEDARFSRSEESTEESDVPIFTELDVEDKPEVPEDYYDSKDVLTTKAPNTDALSVIFGLAGSVVESVAERVMPKSIFDLFKRMQRQNEALEAERLRSREENGGIGQLGRGILKSISTGLSRPFNQLMATRRDNGSLDSDRGFIGSLASGVSSVVNVANSAVDAFKDRVQAIFPGTLWCGDGHSAQARSSDLGLFFFTDTCCRQHDACKLFILAGDTKYGLTNTGLFTRSHCSCDVKFRKCLMRTNSLVSSQIGLTYFNVLGPQCFRRAHPIVRCMRRTRITGQKCEEYELDYTKPKMWQWFDNETF